MMAPAEQLRSLREQTGLSRSEFSRRYDIPLRTLEDWEAGRRVPPSYVIRLLQAAVRQSP